MAGRRKRGLGTSLWLAVMVGDTSLGNTWLAAGRSRKASLVGVSRVTGGKQGWRGVVVDHPHCLKCPKGEAGLELEAGAFPEHSPPYIKSRH